MNRNNLKGRNILGYNAISFLKYLPCFFMLVIEFAGTKTCTIRIAIVEVALAQVAGGDFWHILSDPQSTVLYLHCNCICICTRSNCICIATVFALQLYLRCICICTRPYCICIVAHLQRSTSDLTMAGA